MPARLSALVVFCLLVLLPGCTVLGRLQVEPTRERTRDELTATRRRQLRNDLQAFVASTEQRLEGAADSIIAGTSDSSVRRAALTWKVEMLGDLREDSFAKPPLETLLDSWALWSRVVSYLQDGSGKTLFGDRQEQALRAAKAIRSDADELTARYVPPGEYARLRERITEYVQAHPIEGLFVHENVADFGAAVEGQSLMQEVVQAPWLAVGRVGDALDPTSSLARSVDHFTEEFADYPPRLRWQAQLLLLEIEQLESVQAALQSADRISSAAEQLADVGRTLPESVRAECVTLLDQIDQKQPQLQETIREAKATVAAMQDALRQAETLTGSSESLLQDAGQTAAAWEQTAAAVQAAVVQMQQFGKRDPDAPPAPPRRPFDIIDYKNTAESIQAATRDLSLTLAQVQQLVRGEDLEQGKPRWTAATDQVLGDTEVRLAALIDRAFYRLLILVGVVFAGVLLLRLTRRGPVAAT